MSLPQNALDERRGQFRQVVGQVVLYVRQVVVGALDPVTPFRPAALAHIHRQQALLYALPGHPGHSGQPGRVPVLLVHRKAVLLADGIEVVHSTAVFPVIRRVHLHNGVEAFPAAMYQAGDGQLQRFQSSILLLYGHLIRLHQCVVVGGDILVPDAVAVQWVEPDPRPCIRVPVLHHPAKVAVADGQIFDELSCRLVIAAFLGHISPIPFPRLCDIAHQVRAVKEGLQVGGQLLHWAAQREGQLLPLQPVFVHHHQVIALGGNDIVPANLCPQPVGHPAMILRHGHDGAAGDRRGCGSMEALPLLLAVPRSVSTVRAAPIVPHLPAKALQLQRHTHVAPLLIVCAGHWDGVQGV